MIYGYARVSTDGQSITAQVAQLRKHGAGKVFREAASGAKTDRAQLRRVLDQLDAGDVLMVTRLDRLARSTRDLLNTLAAIAGRKARFPFSRRCMGRHHHGARPFDADRLRRAGGVRARVDPRPHRRRTRPRHGNGVKIGRKPKLTAHQKREAIRRRDRDGEPVLRNCPQLQCQSDSTISRLTP